MVSLIIKTKYIKNKYIINIKNKPNFLLIIKLIAIYYY